MSYAWRQLRKAVDSLVSSGPPRQRLQLALTYLFRLKTKDLPKEARPDFDIIMQSVRYRSKNQLDIDVANSVSDAEVILITKAIVEIFDKVARYQPSGYGDVEEEQHHLHM
jgi:hypothetical protein